MAERFKAHAWKACVRESVPWVRIPLLPPLQNRTANAGRSRFYAPSGGKRSEQIALRPHDPYFLFGHLHPLSQGAEVFAAVAAAVHPDALAGRPGELLDHGGGDRLLPHAFRHRMGAVGVGLGLVAGGFQSGDALLQGRVVQISDAAFDGVVEALEPQIGLGRALVQFGNVLAAAFGALLASVEHRGQDFFEPIGLKQAFLNVAGDKVVQLLHWDGAALAASFPLPRLGGAGVVAIATALAGAQRHRAAALGAEADAGKESGAADDAGGRHLGIAGAQMGLHRVEGGLVNQRRHGDGDHLTDRLEFLGFAALVELVAADVCRAGQDAVNLPMPQRPPSRVKIRRRLRCAVMFFTPIGPDVPSPSRASR